jgi:hypothetical protein
MLQSRKISIADSRRYRWTHQNSMRREIKQSKSTRMSICAYTIQLSVKILLLGSGLPNWEGTPSTLFDSKVKFLLKKKLSYENTSTMARELICTNKKSNFLKPMGKTVILNSIQTNQQIVPRVSMPEDE